MPRPEGDLGLSDICLELLHIEELLGYVIQPSRFVKTFMLFMGEGHNGKTQLRRPSAGCLASRAPRG